MNSPRWTQGLRPGEEDPETDEKDPEVKMDLRMRACAGFDISTGAQSKTLVSGFRRRAKALERLGFLGDVTMF